MERELGKPKCSEDESKFIVPECNTLLHTVFIKSENVCENVEIYENATQGRTHEDMGSCGNKWAK